MLRLAAHTLSASEEALLAGAADPLSQPQQIYELLANADLPWPTITVRGKKVTLDQETYVTLRDDRDPKVREQVFKSFWPVYKSFQRTIGAIYVAHLRGVVFDAARAQVRQLAAVAAEPGQHARRRLPHAGGRGQRRPADAAALPEAARPPAGPEGAEVLRHLRRAREGAAHLHARRGRGADAARAWRRWARTTSRRSASTSRKAGWTPCRARASAPAPT